MPNERTDNAIPYISGQGKPRGFKQTKPPLISQGLVILYFSILFDVLTKQDDTGELALKFDFLFFPALFLAFFLSLQPVSVRPVQCVRRSDWSCPPSLFILIAYLSFPLSLFLSFSPCMTFCSLRKNAFFIKSVSVFLRFVRCVSDVSSLEPYFGCRFLLIVMLKMNWTVDLSTRLKWAGSAAASSTLDLPAALFLLLDILRFNTFELNKM